MWLGDNIAIYILSQVGMRRNVSEYVSYSHLRAPRSRWATDLAHTRLLITKIGMKQVICVGD